MPGAERFPNCLRTFDLAHRLAERHNLFMKTLTCLLLVTAFVAAGFADSTAPTSSPSATPAGGAEEFSRWLHGAIQALQKDLPALAASADAAAKVYLQEGAGIAAYGDIGFTKEITNRSGGIMRMQYASKVPADFKGVVLAYLREDTLDQDAQAATKFHKQGCYVVAFAGGKLLEQAKQKGCEFDAAVDTHAADNDGLTMVAEIRYYIEGNDRHIASEKDSWIVATAPTASLLAVWTWQGEFVAACTRLGKMPPMFQSYAIPGGKDRFTKFKDVKFHEICPPPVAAGVLGKAYLQSVEASYDAVMKDDLQHIRDLAGLVASAWHAGKTAYFYAQNHAQLGAMTRPHEGSYCRPLNANGYGMRKDVTINPGDVVLVAGYTGPLAGKEYAKFQQATADKGATMAWTFSAIDKEALAAVAPGQIVIDQHWALGDAAVEIPGYDIKILSPSGVLSEAILGAVNAETVRRFTTGS